MTCFGPLAGAVVFKQKLSQIATMYQDAKGGFESKVRWMCWSQSCTICRID
jgi:hypothetical protein